MRAAVRVIGVILCCLVLLWGFASMIIGIRGDHPRGRFPSDYAPGATANATEEMSGIGTVVFGASLLVCAVIVLATREVVGAIDGLKQEVINSRQATRSRPVSPASSAPPPTADARKQPAEPASPVLGQLPGESLEAWAKRTEQAELAAFKARSKA